MQRDIKVRFGKINIYHNSQESEFLLYKGLWQSERDRKTRVDEGIANKNTRKIMSGDDSGSTSGSAQVVKDKVIAGPYKGEIVIPVGRILENQGVFAPQAINADFEVEITFPKGKEIMVAQSSQSVAGYELTELKLKYKKIISQELYNAAEQSYLEERALPFKCIDRYKTNKADWVKDRTLVKMRVNIPRMYQNNMSDNKSNETKTQAQQQTEEPKKETSDEASLRITNDTVETDPVRKLVNKKLTTMSKETKEQKKNRKRTLKPPKDEFALPDINPMYLLTFIGVIIAGLSLYYTRKTAMKEEKEIEEAREKVENLPQETPCSTKEREKQDIKGSRPYGPILL